MRNWLPQFSCIELNEFLFCIYLNEVYIIRVSAKSDKKSNEILASRTSCEGKIC